MTAQFQFFQSLPHKKADFVKKSRPNMGYLQILKAFSPGATVFLNTWRKVQVASFDRSGSCSLVWPRPVQYVLGQVNFVVIFHVSIFANCCIVDLFGPFLQAVISYLRFCKLSLRYESFTLILYKELRSPIFQSCQRVSP